MTNRSIIIKIGYSARNTAACYYYIYTTITKLVSHFHYYTNSFDNIPEYSKYIKWLAKQELVMYTLKCSYKKVPLDLVHKNIHSDSCNDYTSRTLTNLERILGYNNYGEDSRDARGYIEQFSLVYDIIIRHGQYNGVYCVLLLKDNLSLKEIMKFDRRPTFLDMSTLFDTPYEYAQYTLNQKKRR